MIIKEVLLSFVDLGVGTSQAFFHQKQYRKGYDEYWDWRLKMKIENQQIYYLKKQELLEERNNHFQLTPKGLDRVQFYCLENVKLAKKEVWDKKWRLISFDIPETKRKERRAFQYRLKALGLIEINKSIFCYPFPCKEQLENMAKFYEISRYVTFFEANYVSSETELINKFKLIKIL